MRSKDEIYSNKSDRPEDGIDQNENGRVSVGAQTDYFLLLYFLEKAPEVMTETFLRVDRDKILNSANLPELIPTVYQRRHSGVRDIEGSRDKYECIEKQPPRRRLKNVTSPTTISKSTYDVPTVYKAEKMDTENDRDFRCSQPAVTKLVSDESGNGDKVSCGEMRSNSCREEKVTSSGKDGDERDDKKINESLSQKDKDTSSPEESLDLIPTGRNNQCVAARSPESNRPNRIPAREVKEGHGKLSVQNSENNQELMFNRGIKESNRNCRRKEHFSKCEHFQENSKETKTLNKRSHEKDRKDRIKFRVRRQRALILSDKRRPGRVKNGKSKFDRLRERSDSSSDDDGSSDSASSNKRTKPDAEPRSEICPAVSDDRDEAGYEVRLGGGGDEVRLDEGRGEVRPDEEGDEVRLAEGGDGVRPDEGGYEVLLDDGGEEVRPDEGRDKIRLDDGADRVLLDEEGDEVRPDVN
ncbi:hypothetical protein LSH36_57g08069 [Paralvinella palmiformis]|uniref:Uncharacterized protein n=1 Tax=Paralvinella palmiformis TaxID=53620 RepID=A0AAD9NE61_9ANNE|nr:hypothetical protein LSH36_57g08069 [Paralvinella palmiformis]